MSAEMSALIKAHAREGLWLRTAPVPEIQADDVLIRVNKNRYLWHGYPHLELG